MPSRRFALILGFSALISAVPSAEAQVGKGNWILLQRGLQVQGMVTKDDVFHLSTYSNANYTAINWLWDANPSSMGPPPGFPWSRWVRNESEMPPLGGESANLSQLVTLQLGDEANLNNDTIRSNAIAWFVAIRSNWPNTILYANNFGGQVNDVALADFYTRAQPDMLCFDTYPWRSVHDLNQPVHTGPAIAGPPTSWYGDLRRYREHARGANLPLAVYRQTFHAVQDYDATVYRDPSPSELRLNTFAALAFNAKGLIDFTYNTGASSLFTTPGGDSNPNAMYSEVADTNLRARNLGKALLRLKPINDAVPNSYTTSILFIRGRSAAGDINPLPIGFVPDDALPNSISDWVADRNDPWLRGWVVTNKAGLKNGGTNGDVIISWFKPLDESLDGPTYSNQIYFMVVNGLSDPTGSAADCLQEIKLNFLNTFSAVEMLNPATGQVTTNTLPIISTRRQLVLNLNGGDAVLFKIANGDPFVGITPIAPRLKAEMSSGVPAITVQGAIGSRYQLESATSLPSTNWLVVTNLSLPVADFRLLDASLPTAGRKYYRAVFQP